MPEGWREARLADLVSIKHGYAFPGDEFSEQATEYVLLTPGNFRVGGGFKGDKLKYYRGDPPKEYMLETGDLIVTMTDLSKNMDTLGFPAWVPDFGDNVALHNQRLGLVNRICDSAHLDFVYYVMCSPGYRHEVMAGSTGTTVHHTSPGRILNYRFLLPPMDEQQGIAAMLGALDDKIASNRRIIELVPSLIRAQVCAGLDAGSKSVAVAELADFVNGGASTKGASGTGRMVIRIAELNSGPGGSTVYNNIDVPEEKTARPGDILMAWSGSLGVYRWVMDEAIVNQHIFKVTPAVGYPAWLIFDRLDAVMPTFRGIAKDKATTMGHIQRGHLNSTSVHVPQPEVIADLDRQIAPLWERMYLTERENLMLAKLRDALLPELLSGRVRVPEAERAMAGVSA